jgi:hypothetical protein
MEELSKSIERELISSKVIRHNRQIIRFTVRADVADLGRKGSAAYALKKRVLSTRMTECRQCQSHEQR